MKRLTTDTPSGNFETMLNFVYGKDGWAYIRHDGEHEDVLLTDWAKRQCKLHGCDEPFAEPPEEIDAQLCDCMMDSPICPVAMAYCFASQAVHLRSRLAAYEDTMPLERAQELAQAEKDGRLVVLPSKVGDTVYIIRDQKIIIAEVEAIHQWVSGKWKLNVHSDKRYQHWVGYEVFFDDFGKTIFLTPEEAEAALKKRKEAENEKSDSYRL